MLANIHTPLLLKKTTQKVDTTITRINNMVLVYIQVYINKKLK